MWTLSNASFVRGADYTTITKINEYSFRVGTNIPDNCTIEFEVLQVDGAITSFFGYFENATTSLGGFSMGHCYGSLNSWVKVKIDVTNSQYVITNKDTGQTTIRTLTGNDVSKFLFRANDIPTIYFKNLKIY